MPKLAADIEAIERTEPDRLSKPVIVKLANIHLTPDKPTYKGGSWHVEGRLVSLCF